MLLVPLCASTNASTTLVPLISNLLLQVQALVQELALILVASSAIASASASATLASDTFSFSAQPHLVSYIPTFIVTAEKSNIAQRHTLQCTTDNVHWTMQLGENNASPQSIFPLSIVQYENTA